MRRGFSYALVLVGTCSVVVGALASCGRSGSSAAESTKDVPRIVSVGGAVTETIFALGAGDWIVAVDTSSVFPVDATARLPHVGYQRQLSAEGVLAQRPTLVLASHEAGPAAALQQLRDAGVRVVLVDDGGFTLESASAKITAIATAVGKEAEGRALATRLADETEAATGLAGRATSRPRVLFVYARGAGAVHVAGRATAADAMIRVAGGDNAISGFGGFKPLTAEAVAQAAPDVILVPARGLASLGGVDGLLAQPGMALTPAAHTRRVIAIDDVVLLGFGPRLGQGLHDLALGLHPELTQESTLSATFTVLEIVLLGRTPHGDEGSPSSRSLARRMLAAVGLDGFEHRRYPSLSGGERQRVHLARVLTQLERSDADHPSYLLLLDEPTSSLDLGHQQRVLALAHAFARAGGAVLVVLHDLSLAARFADQVVLMQMGRVLAAGTPAQVLTPSHIDLAFDCESLVFELNGRIASIVARAP